MTKTPLSRGSEVIHKTHGTGVITGQWGTWFICTVCGMDVTIDQKICRCGVDLNRFDRAREKVIGRDVFEVRFNGHNKPRYINRAWLKSANEK